MDEQENVAIITGASRGIGRAIAVRLAREGYRTVLAARTEEQLREVEVAISKEGGTCLAIPADVTCQESVDRLVTRAREQLGPIDILVNNAGIAVFDEILSTDVDDWIQMFDVNVLGPLRLTRAVLPAMIERGKGRIVMIASTASHKAYRNQAGYCASKHGLLGFSRVLLEEIRGTGVRAHLISPGGVDTDLARNTRSDTVTDEYMAPEEVASAVHFVLTAPETGTVDEVILRRQKASPSL